MYWILSVLLLFTVSCAGKKAEGVGYGYIGAVKVAVTLDGNNKISEVKILEEEDTKYISDRALPIIVDRIVKADSPVVDNVSGASYTSYAVKMAVSKALEKLGRDVEKITIATSAPEEAITNLEDVQADVVIVGGGPAGLTAAITAKENGVENVILVEKLDILSGNGKSDRTFYDLVNTEAQKKSGIEDSADKFYEDMVKRTKETAPDLDRIRAYADGSASLDAWMRGHGITLDHTIKRVHQHLSNSFAGAHIQENLERVAIEKGVDIRTGVKATELYVENGSVTGVQVQRKNEIYNINAKAVIVATGGFSHSPTLIKKYAPQYADLLTSNSKGAEGDFVSIFEKNGIALTNMGVINVYPIISEKTRELISTEDYILVNQEGQRTFDETTTFTDRNQSVSNIMAQTKSRMYLIYDEADRGDSYRIAYQESHGIVVKGDTVEDLAKKLKMDAVNLQNTFDTYDKAMNGEIQDPFGRTKFKNGYAKGPYYAIAVKPAVHMTRGGVLANAKAEVLTTNGTIVKGLYAAGEVANILDGAYVASVVFGRVAGAEAANYIAQ